MVSQIVIDSFQTQRSRIAAETTYGVMPTTPGWRSLGDLRLVPKPVYETERVTGSGDEAPSGSLINDSFSDVEVMGQASYNGIIFPMGSLFGYPTTTTPGGGTFTREHLFTWDGRTPSIPVSYALHYGTPGRVREILGFIFNTLTLGIGRGGMDFGSGGFGKKPTVGLATLGGSVNEVQTVTITGTPTGGNFTLTFRGFSTGTILYNATAATVQTALEGLPTIGIGNVAVTGGPGPGTPYVVTFLGKLGGANQVMITATHALTGGTTPNVAVAETTPGADTSTSIPNVPLSPLKFDIFVDNTWAALGTTKYLAVYNYGMEVGERWARAMPLNSTLSSDGIYSAEEQEHTVALRLGADATADSLYADIEAGNRKFIRVQGIGATLEGALKYEFRADMCLLLSGTDGYDTENGIHVMTWNSQISRDEVSGNAVQILVRNRVTL